MRVAKKRLANAKQVTITMNPAWRNQNRSVQLSERLKRFSQIEGTSQNSWAHHSAIVLGDLKGVLSWTPIIRETFASRTAEENVSSLHRRTFLISKFLGATVGYLAQQIHATLSG